MVGGSRGLSWGCKEKGWGAIPPVQEPLPCQMPSVSYSTYSSGDPRTSRRPDSLSFPEVATEAVCKLPGLALHVNGQTAWQDRPAVCGALGCRRNDGCRDAENSGPCFIPTQRLTERGLRFLPDTSALGPELCRLWTRESI